MQRGLFTKAPLLQNSTLKNIISKLLKQMVEISQTMVENCNGFPSNKQRMDLISTLFGLSITL
jgi:hypothetical protein